MRQNDEYHELTFEDGETLSAKLVIGADGGTPGCASVPVSAFTPGNISNPAC
jgi:2-octaprenyl-3-methyl-6-methoxy-1,4-benzoquinol hydroxylase